MMRDVHTHKVTIPEHWFMFYSPDHFHKEERSYAAVVGEGPVTIPSYDQRCITQVSNGCEPVSVISAERLVERSTGPAEAAKIGNALQGKRGISDYLIAEEDWACIWEELIINKKGAKTFLDREGIEEREYNFSEEMLDEMIHEVDRMIEKYNSTEWDSNRNAQDLVEMFHGHKSALEQERVEVRRGIRVLKEDDFIGPETRRKMRLGKLRSKAFSENSIGSSDEPRDLTKSADYTEFFQKLEEKMYQDRTVKQIEKVVEDEAKKLEFEIYV